jgi:hypothetical protein
MGNQTTSNTEKSFEGFSERDRLYGFINVFISKIDE